MKYGVIFRYTVALGKLAPDEAILEAFDMADLKKKAAEACRALMLDENATGCTAVYNGKTIAFAERSSEDGKR